MARKKIVGTAGRNACPTFSKRKYGWRPDRHDHRDLIFAAPHKREILPASADLSGRDEMTRMPIFDQGSLGSCTANAGAALVGFTMQLCGMLFAVISRLFVYYNERYLEGTTSYDSGASIRDCLKAIARWGAALESLWPYDIKKFRTKPTAVVFADGRKRTALEYRRVVSFEDLQSAIASGCPVIFGFEVYQSFESAAVEQTGIMPMPRRGERILGGHAVLAVGYDNAKSTVKVRNSWGAEWGDKGYFYMPYAFIQDGKKASDFWVLTKVGAAAAAAEAEPVEEELQEAA
jgi:C1A family cysteine protease